jgi:hypothetical protein
MLTSSAFIVKAQFVDSACKKLSCAISSFAKPTLHFLNLKRKGALTYLKRPPFLIQRGKLHLVNMLMAAKNANTDLPPLGFCYQFLLTYKYARNSPEIEPLVID